MQNNNTTDGKIKVLFICVHNSARSQMAEAYLKKFGGDRFEVKSAGLEPGKLNPVVVEAMRQNGIDISGNSTKSVFDIYRKGELFNYVITVCDEASSERCPIFPGGVKKMHWPFKDPSAFMGTDDEKLAKTIEVRDAIKQKIKEWLNEIL